MKVTVIPEDRFISVDNEGLFFDFVTPNGLPNCHAIQWDDKSGHMEMPGTMENVSITYEKDVKPYVELWKAEKQRLDDIINRPLTLEELKTVKLTEINSLYNNATSSLVSTYPSTELLTFDKQEQEARAWLADDTVSTPLIDALALGRGIDKAELVRRIIAKADAFAVATGYLTGQRQGYEDMLDSATTAKEVEAIVPEYKLPEA